MPPADRHLGARLLTHGSTLTFLRKVQHPSQHPVDRFAEDLARFEAVRGPFKRTRPYDTDSRIPVDGAGAGFSSKVSIGMSASYLLLVLIVLGLFGYYLGKSRAVAIPVTPESRLHSVPSYHGYFVALWAGVPAFLLLALWVMLEGWLIMALVLGAMPERLTNVGDQELSLLRATILNHANGIDTGQTLDPAIEAAAVHYTTLSSIGNWCILVLGSVGAMVGVRFALRQVSMSLRARNHVEQVINVVLILCSLVAIMTTVGIVLSLLFEAMLFLSHVHPYDFLFGLQWSPQIAIRADQVGSSGAFGAVPLFTGTLLISAVAMAVAVPIGLLSAIYMAEYAPPLVRSLAKPVLEILAGIPTVVYGFFAALTMAPFVRRVFGAEGLGFDVSSESALAAGVVMGIMIIPFVSSLSDDVINAVPQSLRDGSYGLGATKSETISQVLLPAALPGIVGAILLAVSRAIGETMIVTMAAGLSANLTANPFEAVTTVTVQIATLLVGDQEFDSPKTLSAFGLGLVLFVVTLLLNIIALWVVNKYREKYD